MIEITESKMEMLAENAEKMLRYGGKVMQCIDELKNGRMGERNHDDYRSMGGRMRDEYDNDDERERYGERGYRRRY